MKLPRKLIEDLNALAGEVGVTWQRACKQRSVETNLFEDVFCVCFLGFWFWYE